MNPHVVVAPQVRDALNDGRPVVALESTIFSTLGLPPPHNAEAIRTSHEAVHNAGATPAMTAVLDGVAHVGVAESEWERILASDRKVAARDLPVAIGQSWPVGVTTVSASLRLAAQVGIAVFATGGIGGVHRDVAASDDVSADLGAIAQHPVVTVSAGAKSFLALGRTLERLETLSVPVLGWQTTTFPAFTAASSGLELTHRVDSADEAATIATAQLGLGGGLLVAVPPPEPIDPALLDEATATAWAEVTEHGIAGPAQTPFVLGRIAALTDGASITSNIALARNNAHIASLIAVAIAAVRAGT